MDIALLLVVNCKSDVIIDKTHVINDSVTLYIVKCSNPVFTISSFINISSINELSYRRSKTSFGCVNVKY